MEIISYPIDLMKIDQISGFAADMESADFPINILINCAGLCTGTARENIEERNGIGSLGLILKVFFICVRK